MLWEHLKLKTDINFFCLLWWYDDQTVSPLIAESDETQKKKGLCSIDFVEYLYDLLEWLPTHLLLDRLA